MGNAEQKFKPESKGKIGPSLKGSTKGVQTVERSNMKIHLDTSGKAKNTGRSKPPVPERTSSLEPEERLRNEIDITLPQSKVAVNSRAPDQNLDEEYGTRTEELEIKPERKLMVAAVDIGTTYSGYAFSFWYDHINEANPDNIYLSNWVSEDGNCRYAKTPTCLLLDPDGNLDSFGSAAMEKYSSLTDDNEHHDWYFFWQFKMDLHQEEEIRADTIVTEENGKTLEAIKVFQYSILYLKDRLMKDVNRRFGDRIEETDIRWVFTVPAIWNDSAKKFMRQAAEQEQHHFLSSNVQNYLCPWCKTYKSRKEKPSETDSIKFKISSKTPRGKKDSTKRHHHRHHKRQPGEQQFPKQVVTG